MLYLTEALRNTIIGTLVARERKITCKLDNCFIRNDVLWIPKELAYKNPTDIASAPISMWE
jgi:hypothetical protein